MELILKLMCLFFHCELVDDQGVFCSSGTCKPLKSLCMFSVQFPEIKREVDLQLNRFLLDTYYIPVTLQNRLCIKKLYRRVPALKIMFCWGKDKT